MFTLSGVEVWRGGLGKAYRLARLDQFHAIFDIFAIIVAVKSRASIAAL
jgi:hypothetical protein